MMYDIISKAAGSNEQFVECVPKMKKPTWSLKDVDSAKDVGRRLVSGLKKTTLGCLYCGNALLTGVSSL